MKPESGVVVVVTTHNRPAELAACLASLLPQCELIEKLVIFDTYPGSRGVESSTVRYLLDAIGGMGPTVAIELAPKLNLYEARATAYATFEHTPNVLMLDDDVLLPERYIGQCLGTLAANPKLVGVTGLLHSFSVESGFKPDSPTVRLVSLAAREGVGRYSHGFGPVPSGAIFYRKVPALFLYQQAVHYLTEHEQGTGSAAHEDAIVQMMRAQVGDKLGLLLYGFCTTLERPVVVPHLARMGVNRYPIGPIEFLAHSPYFHPSPVVAVQVEDIADSEDT